ncbi:copper ion binding protein [Trema orientale]|uniref:Copper ion binding protein n=1 Tax=Trema orientale TaxID=63057 RepID=A0A2P5BHE7_TREOI|nr:copper ion binding protein [Trema orientale]
MASRIAARFASRTRRFSSGGKVLSEEEKAAENVYIKKTEQEKLEKLARKGPKPEENPSASSGASATEAKPSATASTSGASTEKVSTDKYRNYAVVAGVITAFGAVGWYLRGSEKKQEVQD